MAGPRSVSIFEFCRTPSKMKYHKVSGCANMLLPFNLVVFSSKVNPPPQF